MKAQKTSKALAEVRNWKKAVVKETVKVNGLALLDYYNEGAKTYRQKKTA